MIDLVVGESKRKLRELTFSVSFRFFFILGILLLVLKPKFSSFQDWPSAMAFALPSQFRKGTG